MSDSFAFAVEATVAGIVASFACGCGALPVLLPGLALEKRIGIGYAAAGGLMFAASVYNLLLPAFTLGEEAAMRAEAVGPTLLGFFAGCAAIAAVRAGLTPERLGSTWLKPLGGRVETLIFVAMTLHSVPEGIAVGVGYGSETHSASLSGLGAVIATAISIHNIPEGLAVALPLRAGGASFGKCFLLATLTSLPQPLAALPASLLVWLFEPLMLPFLGFAAGAMMFLVVVELIPDALETRTPTVTAWAFMIGFAAMTAVQVAL